MMIEDEGDMKELIYLWIYKSENDCLRKMGFNFSSAFDVTFNLAKREITILETGIPNIFRDNGIINVSAIVGENGVGKTTLFMYLLSLSAILKRDEFVAVYYEPHSTKPFWIINNTGDTVYYEGEEIPAYYCSTSLSKGFIEHVSHTYLSNDIGYVDNRNVRSDEYGINSIMFTDYTMRFFTRAFFEHQLTLQGRSSTDGAFRALQSILSRKMGVDAFQTFLDLHYYNYVLSKKETVFGKIYHTVSVGLVQVLTLIEDERQNAGYESSYATEKYIACFWGRVLKERKKITTLLEFDNRLIFNLLYELVFAYNFELSGANLIIEEVLKQCRSFIKTIQDELDKQYYTVALKEVNSMRKLFSKSDLIANISDKNDLAGVESKSVSVEKLWSIIYGSKTEKYSFVLNYLRINGHGMSSGERALQNFMSRMLFASKISTIIPNMSYNFNKNILLLIDEIDLYLHPEWQRRIVNRFISEIKACFPDNYFQIILSSHSPIVLSDIPCKNSIFLERKNGETVQLRRVTQTFGANIHTLYSDAFFIEGGLAMGEFATEYINRLVKAIQDKAIVADEAKKIIALIGEPILRRKFEQLLGHPQVERTDMGHSEREKMIDFLKQQKHAIELQIRMLEGGTRND